MDNKELKNALKRAEKKTLTADERKTKRGSFVELSNGTTHYEVAGEGLPVVLVHGYATPYFIYDKVFDGLVKTGYKVLRYDLFGRGFSDRPDVEYSPEFFAKQLDEISTAVFGDSPFYLVGTSMGGTVCTAFFKEHPEKVLKLALLAPAGMDTFIPPFYMKISAVKGLGEMVFYGIASKTLLKKCASELYHVSRAEKDYYQHEFAEAMQYKGFLRCTLSSLRNTILNTKKAMEGYRAVAEYAIPLLCIWGTKDKTMPYYQHERLLEVCPQTELITYEDEGHVFLFDCGEKTTADVASFFLRKV